MNHKEINKATISEIMCITKALQGDNRRLASKHTRLGLSKLHLRHLRQEGDLHFLALCGQALKQRLAGPLGVEDGGLITLQEDQIFVPELGEQKMHSASSCTTPWTLTKSLRCRAQTRPSPPLLPGPQITSTEGVAFTREVSGYACRKEGGQSFQNEKSLTVC